ncbi:hypothetical protein CCP3SC5AM1_20051 [Gammaproteobacteria bacterium]
MQHRVDTTTAWVNRLQQLAPISAILTRQKRIKGFQTGDMVKAIVEKWKKVGIYIGRVAVRAMDNFNIQTANEVIQGIGYQYCKFIQKSDGYGYENRLISSSP